MKHNSATTGFGVEDVPDAGGEDLEKEMEGRTDRRTGGRMNQC